LDLGFAAGLAGIEFDEVMSLPEEDEVDVSWDFIRENIVARVDGLSVEGLDGITLSLSCL